MEAHDASRTTSAMLAALADPQNAQAWEAFDARYRPILIGFARNLGYNEHDAAEAAQETVVRFLAEWRDGKYDKSRGRLGAWLVGIMRFRLLDQRRQRATANIGRGESAMINMDDDASMSQVWERERRESVLRESLEELRRTSRSDPKTVKAFEMLVYHTLAPKVVADELGMSLHDVYLAKSRVAARLREIVARLELAYNEEPA